MRKASDAIDCKEVATQSKVAPGKTTIRATQQDRQLQLAAENREMAILAGILIQEPDDGPDKPLLTSIRGYVLGSIEQNGLKINHNLGLREAYAEYDTITARTGPTYDAALDTLAVTTSGLQAKAQLYLYLGKNEDVGASLARDLLALA